ncbi:arylesterase [Marinivivus vitaminiproducens]|uniref:arylesterase n=1 Tax=Marinivivus vitaminiproducens TaxID=3035935 RepID=UPI00279CAD57|nr:arylesterase [Geminicoccaceae bacterium SCSIO 64248]
MTFRYPATLHCTWTSVKMAWAGRPLKAAVALGLLAAGAHPAPADAQEPCRISVLGDSLAAGYGLPEPEGFAAVLQSALRERGYDCAVLNAGVPGDTSAGGRSRVDWTLADEPSHVIVELGANDGLRALPVPQMEDNLAGILQSVQQAGLPVLLAGMLAPPNLGETYTQAFAEVFPRLADQFDVPLYPFFLEGVALDPALNQEDRIHPNKAGVERIVANILPTVTAWLDATGVPGEPS